MNSEYQRLTDFRAALLSWFKGGKKGTQPRKVRVGSNKAKRASRRLRVQKDRAKRKVIGVMQRVRRVRGQNVRTGKVRG